MPGHVSHSFLHSPLSTTQTTFDPIASFVSAVNLHHECPPSLLKALADSHPDHEIWLESFIEEMRGIQQLDTYKKITLENIGLFEKKELLGLFPQCVSLPSRRMKISDPFGQSLASSFSATMKAERGQRAKSLLRSFDRILSTSSLVWLLHLVLPFVRATAKNASCQGILPSNEIIIVRLPRGDPEAAPDEYWLLKHTLYSLRRSPRHWYNKIRAILCSIDLTPGDKSNKSLENDDNVMRGGGQRRGGCLFSCGCGRDEVGTVGQ